MIERIITASLRHRGLVLILTLGLVVVGIWSTQRIAIDAIPDLSDVQVVIRTEYPGQAPQVVEDQVTNPIATAMLAVPGARDVRGFSMFGSSFIYILFADGTDFYWARTRVLEQLSTLQGRLPSGVSPQLGPDATGVGWIYQYVLTTGRYSPAHPHGLWHDPVEDRWYARPGDAPDDRSVRQRLRHSRLFAADDPRETCPLSGQALVESDIDLAELRSLQDWYLRYELTPLEGVSEVATAGGAVKEYQITVDPITLLTYDLTMGDIADAVKRSNRDTGGGSLELAETEYMVRGHGYLGSLSTEQRERFRGDPIGLQRAITRQVVADLEAIPLKTSASGIPLTLGQVARVDIGPAFRQGIVEWNGLGETVGAIIVMRHGENARATIARVSERLVELEQTLPPGVAIETAYDRSDLIDRAVRTLSLTLIKEMLAVALVIMLFLFHARSALVAATVLPVAVLTSLTLMHLLGINANIMSLGGIAIAIGVMVDCSIVMVENAHKKLEDVRLLRAQGETTPDDAAVIGEAAREVGPTLFFSLLVITLSFLPIFILGEQSGRLFKPLAYTKTFAMGAASLLAITLTPALMIYLLRETILPARWSRLRQWAVALLVAVIPAVLIYYFTPPAWFDWRPAMMVGWFITALVLLTPQRFKREEANPLTRFLEWAYTPALKLAVRFRWPVVIAAIALVVVTFTIPARQLGTEFMPPLEEGDLLYMPTTVEPGLSITKAKELLQQTDKLIAAFPEVKSVQGKIGRADTATDPAPLNMIETTIILHRDLKQWRHIPVPRFYHDWPRWLHKPLGWVWPSSRPITTDELVYGFTLPDGTVIPGLDGVVQIPGLANAWTMPIRTRLDMLSTGIRTPVGVKVMGSDLSLLAELAANVEEHLLTDPRTAGYTTSAVADRTVGGKYLDIRPRRQADLARLGLTIDAVQEVIESALGGMPITTTVEGIDRYPVNLRYSRDWRDNLPRIKEMLVTTPAGGQIPLAEVADIRLVSGPPMIKSENARPTAWVFVDITGMPVGDYVARAKAVVEDKVSLPPGYSIRWSGQFEYIESARAQFAIAIPLTLLGIALLLYFATRSIWRVLLIFTTLSFSVVGALWLVWLLDYNLSVAVVVGIIAVLGLDAETSLIMLLYLDQSYERRECKGRMKRFADLWDAVHEGAVKRIRPKTMTVLTTIVGLMPLMLSTGAGADTMRRLAAPMIGGLVTSFLLELLIYPALYTIARHWEMRRKLK